ncbi:MAG: acyl-homoserine-lactone synthase, partial [Bacteroidota bacterium]
MSSIAHFHLVKYGCTKANHLLDEMFRLRYQKNVVEGQWSKGITVKDGKEMDEYDHENAFYLIGTDLYNNVLAAARLISTKYPTVSTDAFYELFEYIDIPKSDLIWDCTRLTLRHPSDENTLLTLVAIFEFGLRYSISSYLIFDDMSRIKRFQDHGLCVYQLGGTKLVDNRFEIFVGLLPVMPEIIEVLLR